MNWFLCDSVLPGLLLQSFGLVLAGRGHDRKLIVCPWASRDPLVRVV